MLTEAPFDFLSVRPEGVLAEAVESIWFARGTIAYEQEHISPTGSCVAILVFGDPIEQTPLGHNSEPVRSNLGLFVGPHDGPVINRPLGETHAVGIVTRPTGAERVFGIRPAAYRGRVVQLNNSWPASESIHTNLADLGTGSEKLNSLEKFLNRNLGTELKGETSCRQAIKILEDDPRMKIPELAAKLGMSVSKLDRTFTKLTGLTPRTLSNLLKMRELLSNLSVKEPIDWADLAAAYSWYDQSHFVKAFKRHTGHTPTSYVAAQLRHFDDETLSNAAGFVPQG